MPVTSAGHWIAKTTDYYSPWYANKNTNFEATLSMRNKCCIA